MFNFGSARIQGASRSLLPEAARWLALRQADWIDEEGKVHQWEYVTRISRPSGVAHAVYVVANVILPDGTIAVPIVIQYRPPIDALVVEFPAGLVEEGESELDCAARELYEETGLGKHGTVELVGISKPLCGDPAISASVVKRVELIIDLEQESDIPEVDQFRKNEEHIVSGLVPIQTFSDTIDSLAEQPGYIISSGVQCYADGLRHGKGSIEE